MITGEKQIPITIEKPKISTPYIPSPACNYSKEHMLSLVNPLALPWLPRGSSGNAKQIWGRIHSGSKHRHCSDIWFPGATVLVVPVVGGTSVQCHWIESLNWGILHWIVVAVMATSLNMLCYNLRCDLSCCLDFALAYCPSLFLQPSQKLHQLPSVFSTNSLLLKSAMSVSSVACN